MNDMPMGGFSTESSAMISGKWINRQTGDIVNVRDSIIDGDNMILYTKEALGMCYLEYSNIDIKEFGKKAKIKLDLNRPLQRECEPWKPLDKNKL